MCTIVVIDKIVCHTVADLRHAIYPAEIVWHPDYDHPLPGNTCLCPVDDDATAAAIGRTVDSSDPFFGRYV